MRGRKRHRKKKQSIRVKLRHVKIVVRPRKLNVSWSLDAGFDFTTCTFPMLAVTPFKDEDDPPA